MTPTDLLFDLLHYASKIDPQPAHNGLFPLGVTLRPSDILDNKLSVHKACGPNFLAPSCARKIKDFVATDGYKTNLPAFRIMADSKADLMQQAWKHACPVSSVKVNLPEEADISSMVCISTVPHENRQLEWGRKNNNKCVPLCDYSDECEALSLRGNQGPLHAYLTPLQQKAFDASGELPEGPYFCLLCIRRDIHAFQLAFSTVMNNQLQSGRGTFVIPPFKNIVNAPGGYHESAMSVKEDVFMPIPVHICGVSGTLQVRYDPSKEKWFVDQGSIVYQGDIRKPLANESSDFR